jgi:Uma2 family endonuclease
VALAERRAVTVKSRPKAFNKRIELMVATMSPAEQSAQTVILRNITWPLYRQLLAKKQDSGNPRLAYNKGTLEISLPSFEHEEINRSLANIIGALADEMEIDYVNAGR